MKKIFPFFLGILFLSSCSIQKRLYSPGYYVDWNKNKKTSVINPDDKKISSGITSAQLPVHEKISEPISKPGTSFSFLKKMAAIKKIAPFRLQSFSMQKIITLSDTTKSKTYRFFHGVKGKNAIKRHHAILALFFFLGFLCVALIESLLSTEPILLGLIGLAFLILSPVNALISLRKESALEKGRDPSPEEKKKRKEESQRESKIFLKVLCVVLALIAFAIGGFLALTIYAYGYDAAFEVGATIAFAFGILFLIPVFTIKT